MQNEIVKQSPVSAITDAELITHLESIGLLKDLTAGEKNTFLQIAKAYNLNPFKREIHVSKYNGQMSIITGYETYIKRAERSGLLDGWEVKTEGSVAAVLAESTLKAIITIYRKDRSKPFVWEVKFTEYMQLKDGRLNKFWQKSETMIKKVAMAQGFRLCFNDELGGMPYSKEELDTIDVEHEVVTTGKNKPVIKVVTEPTPEPVKDDLKAEELASAINGLALAETKKDLTDFKKTLPAYIVEDASFIAAGKRRYEVIMAKAI